MEIFKEKEESDVVYHSLDPEGGVAIDVDMVDSKAFEPKSAKARAHRAAHSKQDAKSDLNEMDNMHKQKNQQSDVDLEDMPKDFQEAVVSVEELLDFLDNNEELIDV